MLKNHKKPMRNLFLVCFLLLLSCSSVRHYRKVATDTEVTLEKKAIISPWVSVHFPAIPEYIKGDSVVVYDTTYNLHLIDSLVKSIDSIVATQVTIDVDSLKRAIELQCRPKTVYKTTVRIDTVKIRDEAMVFTLRRDLELAGAENVSLATKLKETEDKLAKASKKGGTYILYIIAAGILVIFQGYLLVKKPKK